MLSFSIAALALGAAPLAIPPQRAGEPDDERVRKAWSTLLPQERFDAAEWFRLEVSLLRTFQGGLVDYALGTQEDDPGTWPDAPAQLAFFDPKEHAPKQPIPRKPLDASRSSVSRRVTALRRVTADPLLESGWRYDWGSGAILRTRDWNDPELIFENGLRGFAPDLDLAQEIVERLLDDGSQRRTLAAFDHAYTDREGGVYPVTLYEAWASGTEIEMPDVDVLGIVHTCLGERRRWVAPVPSSQHKALYDKIGELYVPARRHRGLREALARTYLRGSAVPLDLYAPNVDQFHALWETATSTPSELAKILPPSADWERFLTEWRDRCVAEPELFEAGVRRRETLDADRARIRAKLVWVLGELGAFERERQPEPPAPAQPDGESKGGER